MISIFLAYILPGFLDCFFSIQAINHGGVHESFPGPYRDRIIERKLVTTTVVVAIDQTLLKNHHKARLVFRISFAGLNTGLAMNAIIQTR